MKRLYLLALVLIFTASNVWGSDYTWDEMAVCVSDGNSSQEALLASAAPKRPRTKKNNSRGRKSSTSNTTAKTNSSDVSATETSAQVVINHVVKKGDTFESIAKEYSITVEQLKSDNPGVKKCKEGVTLVVRKDVSVKDATKIKAQNKDEESDKKKEKKEKKEKKDKEKKEKEKKEKDREKDKYKVDKKSTTEELFEQVYLLESEIDQHEARLNALPDDKEHKKERKKEEKEIDKLHKTAVKCYDAIIKKDPSMDAYLGRGTHQMELDKHKQAISDFEKVLTYDNVNKNTREFCQICIKSERAKHQENAERRKAILTAVGIGVLGAAAVAATTAAIVDVAKHGGSTTTTVITTTPAPANAYTGYYTGYPITPTSNITARSSSKLQEENTPSRTSSKKEKKKWPPFPPGSPDRIYNQYVSMIINIVAKYHLDDKCSPHEFAILSKREKEDIIEYQKEMKKIRSWNNKEICGKYDITLKVNYSPYEDLDIGYEPY